MRFIMLFPLICISAFSSFAQPETSIEVTGVVLDAKDGQPVPNAIFHLNNSEYPGSITDQQGVFSVRLPQRTPHDSLVISSLGYQELSVALTNLASAKDTLYFSLQRLPIVLDDVIVNAKAFDPKEIIQKALENTAKNYPDKMHLLKGLYRKISTEDDHYTKLIEAAVTVQDYNYKSKLENKARIRIEQLRQSDELAETDSILITYGKKTAQKFNKNVNSIYQAYESVSLRAFHNPHTVFTPEGFFQEIPEFPQTYTIMDVSIEGNDTIYQIGFTGMNNPPGASYLKINSSDWAIIEYQRGFYFGKDCAFQELVKYKKTAGRYYPAFIRITTPRVDLRNLEDHPLNIETYRFDTVLTKNFKNVRYKDTQNRMQEVQELSYPYDSTFWQKTDLLQCYPLNPAIRMDLEKQRSLETQFKEHAQE